jgi:hypothetical protein
VFRGLDFQAESYHHIVGWTHDYRLIPFETGRRTLEPHLNVIQQAAQDIPALSWVLSFIVQAAGATLAPDRDIFLRVVGMLGFVQNFIVWFTAYLVMLPGEIALYLVAIPIYLAAIAAYATLIGWELGDYLWSVGNLMVLAAECCQNLFEASFGRRGNWDTNMPSRIDDASPW